MIEREEGGECSIEVDEDDWSCDTRKIADRMECSEFSERSKADEAKTTGRRAQILETENALHQCEE